jgi:flagellar basal body-associated protein FliL
MIEEATDYSVWKVVLGIIVLIVIAFGGFIGIPFWRWNKEDPPNDWNETKKRFFR